MFRTALKDLLPFSLLRFLFDMDGIYKNPAIRTETKRNVAFRNHYKGKRCFILGNGPSLSSEPLDILSGEYVFTCNNIGKSSLIKHIVPFAHFLMDARMVEGESVTECRLNIAENIRRLKRYGASPKLFLGIGLRDFAIDSGLVEDFDTYFIFQSGYGYSINYNPDLSRSIPALPTVVQAEILAALYMGFTEIYLLGCDCTGFISLASALSGDQKIRLPYAYATDNADREIVAHVISQSSTADELLNYSLIFRNYELMGEYCKRHGVKLVNLSSGGILNELPRARLEDVVSGVFAGRANG